MKEEKKYSGSKTRNYFTAYLLASIQGRRLRYLEKQQKILFAEENLEDKEITDIDISLEERLELEKKEQLLLDESKGIYPEWNEMTDINLMEAMFSLQTIPHSFCFISIEMPSLFFIILRDSCLFRLVFLFRLRFLLPNW